MRPIHFTFYLSYKLWATQVWAACGRKSGRLVGVRVGVAHSEKNLHCVRR